MGGYISTHHPSRAVFYTQTTSDAPTERVPHIPPYPLPIQIPRAKSESFQSTSIIAMAIQQTLFQRLLNLFLLLTLLALSVEAKKSKSGGGGSDEGAASGIAPNVLLAMVPVAAYYVWGAIEQR
jgi:hypothetical protein